MSKLTDSWMEARIAQLEAAIRDHRSRKADDRCIEDDDRLYAVLKDGIKCDRQVGDKAAMLRNCKRFIENRCEEGKWPTYVELEEEANNAAVFRRRIMSALDILKSQKNEDFLFLFNLLSGCRDGVLQSSGKKFVTYEELESQKNRLRTVLAKVNGARWAEEPMDSWNWEEIDVVLKEIS